MKINIWFKKKKINKIVKNKMLNKLIKKKNLPIIRLKMVKYTYKWLIFRCYALLPYSYALYRQVSDSVLYSALHCIESTAYIYRFDSELFYIYIFIFFYIILLMIFYRQVSKSVILYFILLFMIWFALYQNASESVYVILTELFKTRYLFTI
jgi:hypothetical protein